ncbi:MAG: glycoside hydrolase family 2 [Saprospiraceae bacterium]|nr:glycoside hydrolase family 2 [Saprospiraceae bacterium]
MMLLRSLLVIICFHTIGKIQSQEIPLPEHPRPDFFRSNWQNLNGYWDFRFDTQNQGEQENWPTQNMYNEKILVPFPWGSKLSEVSDDADIGWYHRTINVSPDWQNKRTFLVIGASDWETTVWLDGHMLGRHQGGYTPFSFDLTPYLKYGTDQDLVIKADDVRREFTLYGKQGYGNARGIWQTVYLESRGIQYLDALHIQPDIDEGSIRVTAYLDKPATSDIPLNLQITNAVPPIQTSKIITTGQHKITFNISIPNARLWDLSDPFLYDVSAKLGEDEIQTYFGMRKISVANLPGTDYPYVALNNKPIYLELTLDQSYHPEGFYTFPSDQFMREEVEKAKSIGLNGIRTHVKIEVPRKLYWADKLGVLVMADVPNSWGEPDQFMQQEAEYGLREMIKRDYNHPAIFSWIIFNETWGLISKVMINDKEERKYLPETQNWVASMYYLAKSLDPTRLIEDNSICCGRGHTVSDLNSWHAYLPGWEWDEHLQNISDNTYPGSPFDYEPGFKQTNAPNINSECGNVWGYDGSTGDVDWSYDYHRMMNTFREFPKIAGWLYTEHHDVINEWNGYWRFDRTNKMTGVEEILPGMGISDFHAPVYISTGNDICLDVQAGSEIKVPLYLSSMTDLDYGQTLDLKFNLGFTNTAGDYNVVLSDLEEISYRPWIQEKLPSLTLKMPNESGLAVLTLQLVNSKGDVIHHNFMHFVINGEANENENIKIIDRKAADFSSEEWSTKQWSVLDGKKINGAGSGHFSYTFEFPSDLKINKYKNISFVAELSAKELFVKDQDESFNQNQDYMKGSRVAPSSNPNSYPMTDETTFPSSIEIYANGIKVGSETLADDPADHRGVLSWHAQPHDKKLREAGSYGYLVQIPLSRSMVRKAAKEGKLEIKIQTKGEGGIAIYGKEFGRYPVNPSLILRK